MLAPDCEPSARMHDCPISRKPGTSPFGRAMTVKFHLLDAMDEIPAQLKEDIMRELEAANERIAHFIQLDRLDIVVAAEAWVLRGGGWRSNAPLRRGARRQDLEEDGGALSHALVSDRLRSQRLDVRPKGRSRVAAPRGILPGVRAGEGMAQDEETLGHRCRWRAGHRDNGRPAGGQDFHPDRAKVIATTPRPRLARPPQACSGRWRCP